MKRFLDRQQAGRLLAQQLGDYRGRPDVLVLGLPRGGVPVAAEVALALGAPLDVLVVRKLGLPGQKEIAVGAVASGGGMAVNESLLRQLGLGEALLVRLRAEQRPELQRRERLYRHGAGPLAVAGRTVLVVDDGLATGATMEAALRALRPLAPAALVVAVPVAPADTLARLEALADDVRCCAREAVFFAVGDFYDDFAQVPDGEVVRILAEASRRHELAGRRSLDGPR